MAGRTSSPFSSPFSLLQRFFTSDLSELFDDLAGSRGSRSQSTAAGTDVAPWAPKIDVVQRGNELVVRADLPGVNADDVVVEISDDAITISGERGPEKEEERGSVYKYEFVIVRHSGPAYFSRWRFHTRETVPVGMLLARNPAGGGVWTDRLS
jgi:HSP20 family molecular chaperone IbpA